MFHAKWLGQRQWPTYNLWRLRCNKQEVDVLLHILVLRVHSTTISTVTFLASEHHHLSLRKTALSWDSYAFSQSDVDQQNFRFNWISKSGTIFRRTSDSRTCHTDVSDSRWRHFPLMHFCIQVTLLVDSISNRLIFFYPNLGTNYVEMTCIVSGWALNSTHSLLLLVSWKGLNF